MKGTTTSVNATKERIPPRPNLLSKWLDVVKIVSVDRIRSDADYDRATAVMEEVMAEIGRKKKHPLCGLMDILEMRLREYDDARHPMADVTGLDMLRFLYGATRPAAERSFGIRQPRRSFGDSSWKAGVESAAYCSPGAAVQGPPRSFSAVD